MTSLYLHIPFCVGKCHYCGFYSALYAPQAADRFLAALEQEAIRRAPGNPGRVGSVYMGGGTPSALSPAQLKKAMTIISRTFGLEADCEYTMEANPNSLSAGHLDVFLEQGGNRLSLGVQSFSDEELRFLGRLHSRQQAIDAFQSARNSGVRNIGIDLIYGVSGQQAGKWQRTLEQTLALRPEHISVYCLSLDEGSRLKIEAAAGRIELPEEDLTASQYETAVNILTAAGYEHYEMSNFSLPGFECRHNLNYWMRGDYIGLGPAAWSFLHNRRYSNIADIGEYVRRVQLGRSFHAGEEEPDEQGIVRERVMLALRTRRGLDLEDLRREHGSEIVRRLRENAEALMDSGLAEENRGSLRLTGKGFLLSNEVIARLIP